MSGDGTEGGGIRRRAAGIWMGRRWGSGDGDAGERRRRRRLGGESTGRAGKEDRDSDAFFFSSIANGMDVRLTCRWSGKLLVIMVKDMSFFRKRFGTALGNSGNCSGAVSRSRHERRAAVGRICSQTVPFFLVFASWNLETG